MGPVTLADLVEKTGPGCAVVVFPIDYGALVDACFFGNVFDFKSQIESDLLQPLTERVRVHWIVVANDGAVERPLKYISIGEKGR